MIGPAFLQRMMPLVVAIATTGCARTGAPPTSEQPLVRVRSAHAFAIYEVDVQNDITRGLTGLPEGFEIRHEKSSPQVGYVYAALDGVPQVAMIERVQAWSATGVVPPGDRLLLGKSTRDGVRTHLVKFRAVVDANDVDGAAATLVRNDEWGVSLTFHPTAMPTLVGALSKPDARFRIVVQEFVEEDRLELVDSSSSYMLQGAHGSLPTKMRMCAENTAVVILDARNGVSAKARAEALAAELPPWRSVEECHDERLVPRSPQSRK